MAFMLQLENGEIKEYRTSFGMGTIDPPSNGAHTTSCGMKWNDDPGKDKECNHFDCAISVSKDGRKRYGQLSGFIIIFGIIVILVGCRYDEIWVSFGLFEIILGAMFGLPYLNYYIKNQELEEFKNMGTINGIKAQEL